MTISATRTAWINRIANTSPDAQVDTIIALNDEQRTKVRNHINRCMCPGGHVTWNASKILFVLDELD